MKPPKKQTPRKRPPIRNSDRVSTEETENMNASDRGLKHVCPECTTRYYDLKKKVVACPKCGAKPLETKVPKAARPARKTGGTTF